MMKKIRKYLAFILFIVCMSFFQKNKVYAVNMDNTNSCSMNGLQTNTSETNVLEQNGEPIPEQPREDENLTIDTESEQLDNKTKMVAVERSVQDIISVDLPILNEDGTSPFDFIMDPQQLITATHGVKYGGSSFEEGKTLYFKNRDGEYDYSGKSDYLTMRNRSTVPVRVTLRAYVEELEGISLTTDSSFAGDETNSIYIALVDDNGNVVPVGENGEAVIVSELSAAPEDTYALCYDEEEGKYVYEDTGNTDTAQYATYSFGVIGACNPNSRWRGVNSLVSPDITISWEIEPIGEDKFVTEFVPVVSESNVDPETEETPDADVVPETEETPDADVVPETEETPDADAVPEAEETPDVDVVPETEETPDADAVPEAEETPDVDAVPEAEETPDADAVPETEETPDVEETPVDGESIST